MLRYNPRQGEFFLFATGALEERAKEAGLVHSTTTKGPNGEECYFTDSSYAAIPFYREADKSAADRLAPLWRKYQASWADSSPNHYPIGQGAKDAGYEFLPFQNAGVDYMLEQDNTIIADEMGLGKTAQAIVYDNVKGHERNLVVCPGAVRLGWRRQVNLWSTIPNVTTYPILKGADGVSPYANYVMVSYELLQNPGIHQAIFQSQWDSIHFDEIHYCKTPDAKRTQAIFGGGRGVFAKQPIASKGKNLTGLTGTLLPNRPRECFTAMKGLAWGAIDYSTHDDFVNRYNPRGQLENGHWLEAKGRLPELQARLRCNMMVRRLQKDVQKDLPPIRYDLSYIEPDGAIREVLQQERLLNFSPNDLKNPFAEIWGQISTLRKMMGVAAIPRFLSHIRYMLDVVEVPKLVLFAWHHEILDGIYNALNEEYGVVQVRGGQSALQKQAAIDEFVSGRPRILNGQLLAAGTGVDGLQGVCSHGIILEPDWVPGNNEQAAKRLHRMGQKLSVLIQLMCVEGSLLERILGANFIKTQGIHSSLDDAI